MTKGKKIELLYKIAKGNSSIISAAERKELKKYKVDSGGEYAFYATRKNIAAYVEAVDNGSTILAFRDWCLNYGHADRRRAGSDKASVKKETRRDLIGWAFGGSILWIVCLGTLKGSLEGVFIPAALISAFMCFVSRKHVLFTNSILPIAIAILYCVFR